jgi:hypothetical protein
MANKAKLEAAAVKIGTTVGRAERTARKVGKAAQAARAELIELRKHVQALARELKKSSKRLKRALR